MKLTRKQIDLLRALSSGGRVWMAPMRPAEIANLHRLAARGMVVLFDGGWASITDYGRAVLGTK